MRCICSLKIGIQDFMQTLMKRIRKTKRKKKIQQGCTIIAITGQRICCIIRTLNPSHCDAAYASFGAIAHSAEAHTRSEIAAVSGKRHL